MLNINRFRRIQTIVSTTLFVIVFLLCWNITGFNLKDIQLSKWGIDSKIGLFWNACLVLLSISIYFNVYYYIKNHNRIQYKKIYQFIFLIISISLFLTGVLDMNQWLHAFCAAFYFFAYPLAIFFLAHFNRKHFQYKEWKTHLILSIIMGAVPLMFIAIFSGMAISETIHSSTVIGWNIWINLIYHVDPDSKNQH